MGFCTQEESERFLQWVPALERAMVDSGMLLVKYWLEVSQEEQTRRLQSRIDDPRKVWKLSTMDLLSYGRWYDYSRARDAMFQASDSSWAPWFVADTNDKRRGRLNIITHLLSHVPCEPLSHQDVKLPKPQGPRGYEEPVFPCGTSHRPTDRRLHGVAVKICEGRPRDHEVDARSTQAPTRLNGIHRKLNRPGV